MTSSRPLLPDRALVIERLGALAPLDEEGRQALLAAAHRTRRIAAHREIIGEGSPAGEPGIVMSGWAARVRIFADGRRQILGLLLPGDVFGICRQTKPLAVTGIVALTDVALGDAPAPCGGCERLAAAYARSGALDEFFMYRQIARLGRLSARERMADLLLELRDRLAMVGLATAETFPLVMTQEMLADMLGLTSVHVNRTLQALRRDGLLELHGGTARLRNVDALARIADYRPPPTYEPHA